MQSLVTDTLTKCWKLLDWTRHSLPFIYLAVDLWSTDGASHNLQFYTDVAGRALSHLFVLRQLTIFRPSRICVVERGKQNNVEQRSNQSTGLSCDESNQLPATH